jgi:ABC-type uncharacterized transport system permease subunit
MMATLAGFVAGTVAGVTGVLHTKFKINGLLSGIGRDRALFGQPPHQRETMCPY